MNEFKFNVPNGITEVKTANREEWLQERKRGIGGSDLGHLIGSLFGCERQLWYSKGDFAEVQNPEGQFRLSRGNRQEPVARSYYTDKTGRDCVSGFGTFVVADFPWQRVNVDGVVRDSKLGLGVLEIKTLGLNSFRKVKKDGLPENYIAQAQWGAGILRLPFTSFGIFSPELDEILIIDVASDSAIFDGLVARASTFWNALRYGSGGSMPPKTKSTMPCKFCAFYDECQVKKVSMDF